MSAFPFHIRPATVVVSMALVLALGAAGCSDDGIATTAQAAATAAAADQATAAAQPTATAQPTPTATEAVDKPSVPVPSTTTTPAAPAPPAAAAPDEPTVFMSEVPMTAGAELPAYDTYVTVIDDTGRISVDVPTAWADVDGTPVSIGGSTVADIRASSDLAAFASTWTTPGVIVSAGDVPGVTPEQILDDERTTLGSTCTFQGREPYTDGLYVGSFDTYTACGGTTAVYVVIAARPADGSDPIVEVQVQVNAARDVQALDRIVASFVAI
ncbi:MAG: hypothetical protein ABGZ36_25975 [Actinomycetota bacterium]